MSPNDPQEEPKEKRADSEKEVKRNRFLSMLGFFRRGKKKKDAAAKAPKKPVNAPLAPNAALNTPSQISASGAQARPKAEDLTPTDSAPEVKTNVESPKIEESASAPKAPTAVVPKEAEAPEAAEKSPLEKVAITPETLGANDSVAGHKAAFTGVKAVVEALTTEYASEEAQERSPNTPSAPQAQ
ncbi:MAG: hypothetical protein P1V97_12880, partial [Planctomycetota bacterium]|nr:hypothetical protein [Planctomycetota bacterium]